MGRAPADTADRDYLEPPIEDKPAHHFSGDGTGPRQRHGAGGAEEHVRLRFPWEAR